MALNAQIQWRGLMAPETSSLLSHHLLQQKNFWKMPYSTQLLGCPSPPWVWMPRIGWKWGQQRGDPHE